MKCQEEQAEEKSKIKTERRLKVKERIEEVQKKRGSRNGHELTEEMDGKM